MKRCKKLVGVLIALAMFAVFSTAALAAPADNGPTNAQISAGTFSEIGTFNQTVSTTITNTDQTLPYHIPILVNSLDGGGAGWKVQILATDLSDGASHVLPQSLVSASITCRGPGTCTSPTPVSLTYPLVLGTVQNGTPSTLYNADVNTGMGVFDLTDTVNVLVSANAFASTYQSTVTLAISHGP